MPSVTLTAYNLEDKRNRIEQEAWNLIARVEDFATELSKVQDEPAVPAVPADPEKGEPGKPGKPESKMRTNVNMALIIEGHGISALEAFRDGPAARLVEAIRKEFPREVVETPKANGPGA